MLRPRTGFTLIELLIVVVIIGILAAIAIPKLSKSKESAYKTAATADLRNLVTAEEAFFADSSKYSANVGQLKLFQNSAGVTVPAITTGAGSWSATNAHTQLAGVTCGVAINTTNPVVASANEGQPICK